MKNALTLRRLSLFTLAFLLFLPFIANAGILSRPTNNLGLVGYWPLDDGAGTTARDASGNGNNGSLMNSPTWTTGEVGGALGFATASHQYVTLPKSLPITGNNSRSIFVWIKAPTSVSQQMIVATGIQTNSEAFNLVIGYGAAHLVGVMGFFDDFYPTTGTAVDDGKWHLIGVTFDGVTTKIYVDGVLDNFHTETYGTVAGANYLGANIAQLGFENYFNGTIDDVRIYNRTLSQVDITALYNLGAVKLGTVKRNASPTSLLSNGLVGYWTFDGKNTNWNTGTTADVSGQGNTGTLVAMSTSTSGTIGKIGQAFSFDGAASYIAEPNSSLNVGATFTMTGWMKVNRARSDFHVILSKGPKTTGHYEIYIAVTTGELRFFSPDLANSDVGSGYTIDDGKWHHVAISYNGSTMTFYVDGSQVATQVVSGTISNQTALLDIGKEAAVESPKFFSGSLDDLRIYNRALSPTEIQQLYQAGGGVTQDTSNPQVLTRGGLVGHWSFDGKNINWTTGQALDTSGQGNSGSLVGMSTTTSPVIGKIGQALSFNGSSSYVQTSYVGVSGTAARSFTMWVKTTQTTPGSFNTSTMLGYGNLSSGHYFSIATNDKYGGGANFQGLTVDTPGVGAITYAASSLYDGAWHFVSMVIRSNVSYGGIQMYLDGVLLNTVVHSLGGATINTGTGSNVLIGSDAIVGNGPFQGSLDDVRIYNRTLTASEIQTLYDLGR
jgi:hypothetical protein